MVLISTNQDLYLEMFWCSTTVKLQHQIAFVVSLMDLKYSLSPFGRAHIQAGEADADSTTTAQLRQSNGH